MLEAEVRTVALLDPTHTAAYVLGQVLQNLLAQPHSDLNKRSWKPDPQGPGYLCTHTHTQMEGDGDTVRTVSGQAMKEDRQAEEESMA